MYAQCTQAPLSFAQTLGCTRCALVSIQTHAHDIYVSLSVACNLNAFKQVVRAFGGGVSRHEEGLGMLQMTCVGVSTDTAFCSHLSSNPSLSRDASSRTQRMGDDDRNSERPLTRLLSRVQDATSLNIQTLEVKPV
jgi:hypothetical protein